ncbi:hypothetical protein [Methylomonas rhizoryzae]|uniref:hypothetical protein n=1 Tax=Methylomonas rhizoryzae TaxID=2608981 RepID=UPI0012325C93|nr:hypothetical protein [Methylomonas rhizoryzae]
MIKSKITAELIQFTARPWWYTIQGFAMIAVGIIIAVLCIISPNVYMISNDASWGPAIGIILVFIGALRCIDGISSENAQGFLFNMQGGVLDFITGMLVASSNTNSSSSLNMLIVGYLLTQGIYRNILLSVAEIPNPLSNKVTGFVSILLGIIIWAVSPESLWFIAFSLSVDIGFRGWTLITMASSLKENFR